MPPLRYRCTACGNLTRFDVTVTRTTRAFHHYTVGGDLVREDEEVLAETVEDVSCRWCGHGRDVDFGDGGANPVAATEGDPGSPEGADGARRAATVR